MTAQTLNRFEWLKAVMQVEDLSATTKNVAAALAIQFANDETGQINPSQETVADYLKVHKDTVKRALRELRNAGWLLSLGDGGRGKSPMMRLLSPSKIIPFRPVKGGQNTPRNAPERCAEMHPKAEKRGDDLQRKGGQIIPPHYKEEQYKEQKSAGATGDSAKPTLNNASVAHFGGDRETAWDRYLTARGWPTLAKMGVRSSDAAGIGWEIPFRIPPSPDAAIPSAITARWVHWAIERMEARHAA